MSILDNFLIIYFLFYYGGRCWNYPTIVSVSRFCPVGGALSGALVLQKIFGENSRIRFPPRQPPNSCKLLDIDNDDYEQDYTDEMQIKIMKMKIRVKINLSMIIGKDE